MSALVEVACCTDPPPLGVISLSEKQHPICEMPTPHNKHYCFTRAVIDIAAWKTKLASLPPSIWEDENQEGNVRLTRPAHDAWGIKKIIFTFCDDFLLKVLDLPWSQEPSWSALLLPVYAALGVDPKRVVRSLLASMPPGVVIPVHHDTGYWVKRTHRCHLAIQSGELVEFLVGPTEEAMKQVNFKEGYIVELNNQAKHSVANNMTTNRVHLIFDYVDEGYSDTDCCQNRVALKAGEVVYQTRRSIDLAAHHTTAASDSSSNSNNAPRFVIIGAQKCGTTSMYENICQHPLVAKGKRRETHYFDWRFNHSLEEDDAEAHYKYYMNFFEADALAKHKSIVTGESTPSYLFHADIVIPRIKLIIPLTKILVMLRNPTDRAFSQYQMCIDKSGTAEQLQVRGASAYCNMTFEQAVVDEIRALQAAGITADCSFDVFQKGVLQHCPLTHGGHSIVARGLYVLQLRQWFAYFPKDQIKILSINDIKSAHTSDNNAVQQCMDEVFQFINLPPIDIEDLSARNARSHGQQMTAPVRKMLDEFFHPFNEALLVLLGKESIQW